MVPPLEQPAKRDMLEPSAALAAEGPPPAAPADEVPPAPEVPQGAYMPAETQKLHERLNREVELCKLHVKHYHMSLRQFRARTSELALPGEIYDK